MWIVPALDEDSLIRMRAPPDPSEAFEAEEDDSADEDHRTAPGPFQPTLLAPATIETLRQLLRLVQSHFLTPKRIVSWLQSRSRECGRKKGCWSS